MSLFRLRRVIAARLFVVTAAPVVWAQAPVDTIDLRVDATDLDHKILRVEPESWEHWDEHIGARDLLPHEYTHSWNDRCRTRLTTRSCRRDRLTPIHARR